MTQKHSHTPSPARVKKWEAMLEYCEDTDVFSDIAQWGADQELEAILTWLRVHHFDSRADALLAARRPKPPSIKELALTALIALDACAAQSSDTTESVFYIRRALESLPE